MDSVITGKAAIKYGIHSAIKAVGGLPYRAAIAKSWHFSRQEFERYQLAQLRAAMAHAVQHAPFYRERAAVYSEAMRGSSVREILRAVPRLGKAEVRSQQAEFYALRKFRGTTFHTTSGTSGAPLRIPVTLAERCFGEEVLSDYFRRMTRLSRRRNLCLSGFVVPKNNELGWYDPITKSLFLSIYDVGPKRGEEIRRIVAAFDPQAFIGYASAIHQLASVVGGRLPHSTTERHAFVTSEVLNSDWRKEIEGSLNARVCDFYGSQEGAHLAIECKSGRFHVHPLIGVIEVLNADGTETQPGDIGSVVVTGLARRAFPLIRYEIGDSVMQVSPAEACECGLHWPMIGSIYGRSEDLVLTPDGRKIGYLCFHATKNLKGIRECQLRQKSLSDFECLLSLDDGVEGAPLESSIRAEIQRRLASPVTVRFQRVDSVPRGANGKFRAVVVDMK